MPKHKVSVYGDNALREFYEACGLAPETIEGAIKIRYQEPPPVTAARETNLVKRLRERRKRNSAAKDTEG